jgi:hypothetical protein
MTIRADGRKKSEFIAKDTVQAGGYLDYVVNGTNYKISYDNFVANLGVTGSIVQTGAVTGAAILDVQGSVNNIRNLESGAGIAVSVSPENGAKISHNFTASADGFPILLNTTAASPTIASIVAGSGISIATVNSSGIQISSIADEIYAQVTMHGNTTATVISTINVPVKVAGTWVVGTNSSFTASTTGRLTYTGGTTETVGFKASVTLVPVGTNQVLTIQFAKNGVAIPDSRITRTVSAGASGNVSLFYNASMTASDYMEIFVSNGTSTNDITVVDCLFGVS